MARVYHAQSEPVPGSLFGQAMRMIRQTLLLLVFFASPIYSDDPKGERIRHYFLGLWNGARSSMIAEDGPFSWNIDLPAYEGIPISQANLVKLTEVTREKKVVWTYSGGKHGFHHFQVLTTNGKPLKDNTMK